MDTADNYKDPDPDSNFKCVVSGKQNPLSLIGFIVQTRQLALFETDKTFSESPVVIMMLITCHTLSREIQNLLLLLATRNGFGPKFISKKVTWRSENENPREKNVSGRSRDIYNANGLILLPRGGGPSPKSASQTRVAELFRPLQSLKSISAVLAHQSARVDLSRYPE